MTTLWKVKVTQSLKTSIFRYMTLLLLLLTSELVFMPIYINYWGTSIHVVYKECCHTKRRKESDNCWKGLTPFDIPSYKKLLSRQKVIIIYMHFKSIISFQYFHKRRTDFQNFQNVTTDYLTIPLGT